MLSDEESDFCPLAEACVPGGASSPGLAAGPSSERQGLLRGRTSYGLPTTGARSVDGPSGLLSPGTESSTARIPSGPGPREAIAPPDSVAGFPPARLSLRAAVFICLHVSVAKLCRFYLLDTLPVRPFLCSASAPASFGGSRLRAVQLLLPAGLASAQCDPSKSPHRALCFPAEAPPQVVVTPGVHSSHPSLGTQGTLQLAATP